MIDDTDRFTLGNSIIDTISNTEEIAIGVDDGVTHGNDVIGNHHFFHCCCLHWIYW